MNLIHRLSQCTLSLIAVATLGVASTALARAPRQEEPVNPSVVPQHHREVAHDHYDCIEIRDERLDAIDAAYDATMEAIEGIFETEMSRISDWLRFRMEQNRRLHDLGLLSDADKARDQAEYERIARERVAAAQSARAIAEMIAAMVRDAAISLAYQWYYECVEEVTRNSQDNEGPQNQHHNDGSQNQAP